MQRSYTPRRGLPKPNLKIDFALATVLVIFGIMFTMHIVASGLLFPDIQDVQETLANTEAQSPEPNPVCLPGVQLGIAPSDQQRE